MTATPARPPSPTSARSASRSPTRTGRWPSTAGCWASRPGWTARSRAADGSRWRPAGATTTIALAPAEGAPTGVDTGIRFTHRRRRRRPRGAGRAGVDVDPEVLRSRACRRCSPSAIPTGTGSTWSSSPEPAGCARLVELGEVARLVGVGQEARPEAVRRQPAPLLVGEPEGATHGGHVVVQVAAEVGGVVGVDVATSPASIMRSSGWWPSRRRRAAPGSTAGTR